MTQMEISSESWQVGEIKTDRRARAEWAGIVFVPKQRSAVLLYLRKQVYFLTEPRLGGLGMEGGLMYSLT